MVASLVDDLLVPLRVQQLAHVAELRLDNEVVRDGVREDIPRLAVPRDAEDAFEIRPGSVDLVFSPRIVRQHWRLPDVFHCEDFAAYSLWQYTSDRRTRCHRLKREVLSKLRSHDGRSAVAWIDGGLG